MDSIPSNYFMKFSKLKEYLEGWVQIAEEDEPCLRSNRMRRHLVLNKIRKEEIVFSHEYPESEGFSDETIVGTNEIRDHYLSMMINQIVGFDIQEGKFSPENVGSSLEH